MARTVDERVVVLRVDGQSAVAAAFRSIEHGAERARHALGGIAGAAKNAVLGMVAVGAGAAALFAKQALELAVARDQQIRSLQALMGSADAATRHFERLQEAAKMPGVDVDAALQTSVRLQSIGFSAQFAEEAAIELGNAIALTGGGADDLAAVTQQLQQMVGLGRVTAEDFNVIAQRIPNLRGVAESVFGTADLEKLREAGVTAKDFVTYLVMGLKELPRAPDTIGNALANLKVAWEELLIAFGKGFTGEEGMGAINSLAAVLENLKPLFEDLGTAAAKWLPVVSQWLDDTFSAERIDEYIRLFLKLKAQVIGAVRSLAIEVQRGLLNAVQAMQSNSIIMKVLEWNAKAVPYSAAAALYRSLRDNNEITKQLEALDAAQQRVNAETEQAVQMAGQYRSGLVAQAQASRQAAQATEREADALVAAGTARAAWLEHLKKQVSATDVARATLMQLEDSLYRVAHAYDAVSEGALKASQAHLPQARADMARVRGAVEQDREIERRLRAFAAQVIDPQVRAAAEAAAQAATERVSAELRASGEQLSPMQYRQKLLGAYREELNQRLRMNRQDQARQIADMQITVDRWKAFEDEAKRNGEAIREEYARREREAAEAALRTMERGYDLQDQRLSEQSSALMRQIESEATLAAAIDQRYQRELQAARQVQEAWANWARKTPAEQLAWAEATIQRIRDLEQLLERGGRPEMTAVWLHDLAQAKAQLGQLGPMVSGVQRLPGGGTVIGRDIPSSLLPAYLERAMNALGTADAKWEAERERDRQHFRIELFGMREDARREQMSMQDRLVGSVLGNLNLADEAVIADARTGRIADSVRGTGDRLVDAILEALASLPEHVARKLARDVQARVNRGVEAAT